jgi:hypothetical protein
MYFFSWSETMGGNEGAGKSWTESLAWSVKVEFLRLFLHIRILKRKLNIKREDKSLKHVIINVLFNTLAILWLFYSCIALFNILIHFYDFTILHFTILHFTIFTHQFSLMIYFSGYFLICILVMNSENFCICTSMYTTLYTENQIYVLPEMKLRGLVPNSYIFLSVSDLYIPRTSLPIWLEQKNRPILGIYNTLTDAWMWKLGEWTL